MKPGEALELQNFEPDIEGGYKKLLGTIIQLGSTIDSTATGAVTPTGLGSGSGSRTGTATATASATQPPYLHPTMVVLALMTGFQQGS